MKFSTRIQKVDAVDRVNELRESMTLKEAVREVGCSLQQYQRWNRGEGLGKRGVSAEKRTGRPPVVQLTEAEANALHFYAAKKESITLAVEKFLAEYEEATDETIEVMQNVLDRAARARKAPNWPMSIRRACKVTEEEAAWIRGEKAKANVVPVGFRKLTWIDADGTEHELRPGDLYESDDMSVNQPFRYCGADGEETLGRQVLFTNDVTSLKFLGASPLGRPKDAYRVEDIADHMLSIIEAWGMPLFWRLERGPWENDFVNGVNLKSLGERFEKKRWGGLDDLFKILRAYGSRGKGALEGSFNFYQALLQHENDTVEIGRHRGEFEEAMKSFLKARSIKDPARRQKQLDKFWNIEQCANGLLVAMESFNGRPKSRREWADMQVPDELWMEHPGKRELAPENRWYFYPVKKLATVRTGQIHTSAPHWGKRTFTVNGVPDAPADYLPHGLKVLIAFDPARPELGCYVCNADVTSLNRSNWGFGELLVPNAPDWSLEQPAQVDFRPAAQKRRDGQSKRNAAAALRTEFRATKDAAKPKETPHRKAVARDGLGQQVAVANYPGTELPSGPAQGSRRKRREQSAAPGQARGKRPAESNEVDEVDADELARLEAEAAANLF